MADFYIASSEYRVGPGYTETQYIELLPGAGHNPSLRPALLSIREYGPMSAAREEEIRRGQPVSISIGPVDMLLYCPACSMQHVDRPQTQPVSFDPIDNLTMIKTWYNPPHRTHLCEYCGCLWRPADVPTNGVQSIKTKGKNDTWVVGAGVSGKSPLRPEYWLYEYQRTLTNVMGMVKRGASETAVRTIEELRERWNVFVKTRQIIDPNALSEPGHMDKQESGQ